MKVLLLTALLNMPQELPLPKMDVWHETIPCLSCKVCEEVKMEPFVAQFPVAQFSKEDNGLDKHLFDGFCHIYHDKVVRYFRHFQKDMHELDHAAKNDLDAYHNQLDIYDMHREGLFNMIMSHYYKEAMSWKNIYPSYITMTIYHNGTVQSDKPFHY